MHTLSNCGPLDNAYIAQSEDEVGCRGEALHIGGPKKNKQQKNTKQWQTTTNKEHI